MRLVQATNSVPSAVVRNSGPRFAARSILTTTRKAIQEICTRKYNTYTTKSAPVLGGIECGINASALCLSFFDVLQCGRWEREGISWLLRPRDYIDLDR